jgi:hypothetical protein
MVSEVGLNAKGSPGLEEVRQSRSRISIIFLIESLAYHKMLKCRVLCLQGTQLEHKTSEAGPHMR